MGADSTTTTVVVAGVLTTGSGPAYAGLAVTFGAGGAGSIT